MKLYLHSFCYVNMYTSIQNPTYKTSLENASKIPRDSRVSMDIVSGTQFKMCVFKNYQCIRMIWVPTKLNVFYSHSHTLSPEVEQLQGPLIQQLNKAIKELEFLPSFHSAIPCMWGLTSWSQCGCSSSRHHIPYISTE